MPTAHGYCRVSTDQQAQSGLGLDAQKEAIMAYYNYKLVPVGYQFGGFFVDEAVSGKVAFQDRPQGSALCKCLEKGDAVVISKLDRGFRKVKDFMYVVDLWAEKEVSMHLLDMGMDTSTEVGRLMVRIMACFAEFERARIAERTREAIRQRTLAGNGPKGSAPIGSRWVGAKGRRRMVKDEYEQGVMEQILALKLKGHTWHGIWRHLIENRVKTRKGNEWSLSRIRRAYFQKLIEMAGDESAHSARSS